MDQVEESIASVEEKSGSGYDLTIISQNQSVHVQRIGHLQRLLLDIGPICFCLAAYLCLVQLTAKKTIYTVELYTVTENDFSKSRAVAYIYMALSKSILFISGVHNSNANLHVRSPILIRHFCGDRHKELSFYMVQFVQTLSVLINDFAQL